MMQLITPAIVWMVGGIVAWLAGRYHLTLDQQQLVSADILGGIGFAGVMVGGLWLHWRAYWARPPAVGGGTPVYGPTPPMAGNPYGGQNASK